MGDRLDTDIAGANRVGADSLLVLTGVTGLQDVAAAPPTERATFVSADLSGLRLIHAPVTSASGSAVMCQGWVAHVRDDEVWTERRPLSSQSSDAESDRNDLVRAAVTAAWRHRDSAGTVAGMSRVSARLREMMAGAENEGWPR